MFDNIPAVASLKSKKSTSALDALDIFLAAPSEDALGDPIGWWEAHCAIFGTLLVRMAQSYLAVPGTSQKSPWLTIVILTCSF